MFAHSFVIIFNLIAITILVIFFSSFLSTFGRILRCCLALTYGFITFNKRSNIENDDREMDESVLKAIGNDRVFFVGYVIKNKKRITI